MGWKNSPKGWQREIIETVAQTIQNYVMSVFLLPLDMCTEMKKEMCKFW